MQVTILADSVREITSRKTGKPVTHHMQEIFVRWSHEPFPRPTTIYLGADNEADKPYPPGEYELDVEKSLTIQNERLTFRNIKLQPIKHDPPKART